MSGTNLSVIDKILKVRYPTGIQRTQPGSEKEILSKVLMGAK